MRVLVQLQAPPDPLVREIYTNAHQFCKLVQYGRLTGEPALLAFYQSVRLPPAEKPTMNPPANVHRLPNRDAALKSLYDDIAAKSMFPFWAQSSDVTNDEIKQLMGGKKAVPYVWRCAEDIEPILNRAVELINNGRFRAPLAGPGQSGPGAQARDRLDHVHGLSPERRQRDHAAAQAFAERDPVRPEGQGQFHRRRRREHRVRSGRHGADAERYLAQSRHGGGRAGAQSFGARLPAGRDPERGSFRP